MADSPATENPSKPWVDLASFTTGDYDPGGGKLRRVLWWYTSLLLFESGWFLPIAPKRVILRWFGARIGKGVVIKPHLRIKYPWRLAFGDHCWIGQGSWFDNIEDIRLGDHVCVSQDVYLCTGSHDHRTRTFDLTPGAIVIENGAWVAASSLLLPGVVVGANALVAGGSVVTKSVEPGKIVGGNPAQVLRDRQPPQ
ncbi:Maltose O-acetyltransferase [Pseudobythopirellula maris]|uniref:Maltose O-acetyltransferase n=1 Tax=Pseudobythopirellula maris TaxID=2527991 RepID=A0A5C5ZPM5_9BACT|nr:WcaF family extracellular polysaccharide biosynthesis acetyltransferase [Pseudobythopirellula maris]TWT88847.1 Maltose O-acetyltransferase [Pseudobythopirellula maris]